MRIGKKVCSGLMAICVLCASVVPVDAANASANEQNVSTTVEEALSGDVMDSGQCGDNATWSYTEDGVLTVSGTGDMWNFVNDGVTENYHELPWVSYLLGIKKVVIGDGITHVGAGAFWGCQSLETVEFGQDVATIWHYAFRDCEKLQNFTLPDSLTSLGQEAFAYCGSLTKVSIPDKIQFIDASAFGYCALLKEAYIGGNKDVGSFVCGNSIFLDCPSLESIQVSKQNIGLTSVDGVLYTKDKTYLLQYPSGKKNKKYTVAKKTKEIMQFSFEGVQYLQEIVLPNGLLKIGTCNFRECPKLKKLIIPASVTTIESDIGVGCGNLKYIQNKSKTPMALVSAIGFTWVNGKDKEITSMKKGIAYQRAIVKNFKMPTKLTLKVGQQKQLINKIIYAADNNIGKKVDLTYKSSNPKVVKVGKKGMLTALKVGTAIITVQNKYTQKDVGLGKVKKKCKVTVKKKSSSSDEFVVTIEPIE